MESANHLDMAESQNSRISQAVRKEGARLLGFIRRQVNDVEDAQDILQDTFFQLTESERSLETIERVAAWLFRVAKNKIADFYRKKKPVTESRLSKKHEGEEFFETSLFDILPSTGMGPEELLERETIWVAIEAALEDLPTAQREVFVWHELEGVSFKEIAEWTGETENTLRLRKYQAVQSLRQMLAIYYNND